MSERARHCYRCKVELVVGENWAERKAACGEYICRACAKEYATAYYKANRERILAQAKARYGKGPKGPTPLVCRDCGAELTDGEGGNRTPYDAKRSLRICRECKSARNKAYRIEHGERLRKIEKERRARNPEVYRARSAKLRQDPLFRAKEREYSRKRQEYRRVLLNRFKSMKGCLICGERCWACLEFHAPNGHKDLRPPELTSASMKRIKAELSRCVVVCANCHHKLHAGIVELPEEKE